MKGLEGYIPVKVEDGTYAVGSVQSRRVNATYGWWGYRRPEAPGVYSGPGSRERRVVYDCCDGGFTYAEARRIATKLTKQLHLRNRARKYTNKALRAIGISEAALVKLKAETLPFPEGMADPLTLQREAHWKLLSSISLYTLY